MIYILMDNDSSYVIANSKEKLFLQLEELYNELLESCKDEVEEQYVLKNKSMTMRTLKQHNNWRSGFHRIDIWDLVITKNTAGQLVL